MICAYADPPYIGQAAMHYSAPEVDHGYLIRSLVEDYPDGWALSFGATRREVATIAPLLPEGARLAAWVKPSDTFVDVFTGSGAMMDHWRAWCRQGSLFAPQEDT